MTAPCRRPLTRFCVRLNSHGLGDVSLIDTEDAARLAVLRRLNRDGWANELARTHPRDPGEAAASLEELVALYEDARRDLFGANYWRRRWGCALSPTATKLVEVLRSHCYHNRHTRELRDTYFCDFPTLAHELHTNVTALKRLLMMVFN